MPFVATCLKASLKSVAYATSSILSGQMRFQWLRVACSGFLSVTYERSNIVIICVSIRSFILIFALFPTFPHNRGGREKKERCRKKQGDDDAVFDRFARNR